MIDKLAEHIAIPSLITGIPFLIVGLLMYYYPPKEINGIYGYRTGSSMKSQERWDFAQKYSAGRFIVCAATMIGLSLLSYFIPVPTEWKQIGGIALLIVSSAYVIIATEIALRKRFPKSKE